MKLLFGPVFRLGDNSTLQSGLFQKILPFPTWSAFRCHLWRYKRGYKKKFHSFWLPLFSKNLLSLERLFRILQQSSPIKQHDHSLLVRNCALFPVAWQFPRYYRQATECFSIGSSQQSANQSRISQGSEGISVSKTMRCNISKRCTSHYNFCNWTQIDHLEVELSPSPLSFC